MTTPLPTDRTILPLNLEQDGEGKRKGNLSDMPMEFLQLFHDSIVEFLKDIPQSENDWCCQIKDEDRGLAYQLYYNHGNDGGPNSAGFMVMARVGTYDLDKKELLSDEHDKIIVFRFTTPNELICQTQPQK